MRLHRGEHPRMGATDVCPLVPIRGISLEAAIELALELASRVGQELHIPVYLYEHAARNPQRRSLADIRAGEYEGFRQKILLPEWKPDFGPQEFNEQAGQTVIGVRDFLIAYNVNLNTRSVRRANAVAFDVREAGRVKTLNGETVRDSEGRPVRIPGTLKHVRAIGWYLEDLGLAQVSLNLTNIQETPLHRAFEEVEKSAIKRGLRVTGSELVGLVPLQALLEAGKYFLRRQGRSVGVPEAELVQVAVRTLGLNELYPFKPQEKIIEYALEGAEDEKLLINRSVRSLVETVASESPAPGGGSVAALIGSLGAALGCMVANLSANKRGWDERVPYFSERAERLWARANRLLSYFDRDARSFDQVLEAYRLPDDTESAREQQQQAIQQALKKAIESPIDILRECVAAYADLKELAETGNPNSITDAGVGALALHAGAQGAAYNVEVNLADLTDDTLKALLKAEVEELLDESTLRCNEICNLVDSAL
jgi:glutamate formiminotransferase/formiminotetrahydrofolate cyclodeaminase